MTYSATAGGQDYSIDIEGSGGVVVDDRAFAVDLRPIDGEHLYSLLMDNESYELFVERREGMYYVLVEGDRYVIDVEDARLRQLKAAGEQAHQVTGAATVAAPMPGLVVRLLVEPGQAVGVDQGLLILEAMKMENEIRSPQEGVVKSINVQAGQAVNPGDVLAVVESEE